MSWHPIPPPPALTNLKPMLLDEQSSPPFDLPGWLYEIKLDGYRVTAGIEDGQAQLRSRTGADASVWFPEIVQGLRQLRGGPHILDGEVCVLDEAGSTNYERLHERARKRKWFEGADPVIFYVFDVLQVDGTPVMDSPLEERKRLLEQLLTPLPPSVRIVDYFDARKGQDLYSSADELHLEGLVAKRLGSPYVPGVRSRDWVKCKRQGAIKPAKKSRGPDRH